MAKQGRAFRGAGVPASGGFTPHGVAERLDRLFWSLSRQRGWRRGVARASALLALLIIAGLVVTEIVHVTATGGH
ncbi:MAG: hypothetical protein J2P28_00835 [Actinobacteria bacterium]|nr:hypothetical protein [Actinomycetota bacterium]